MFQCSALGIDVGPSIRDVSWRSLKNCSRALGELILCLRALARNERRTLRKNREPPIVGKDLPSCSTEALISKLPSLDWTWTTGLSGCCKKGVKLNWGWGQDCELARWRSERVQSESHRGRALLILVRPLKASIWNNKVDCTCYCIYYSTLTNNSHSRRVCVLLSRILLD